MYDRAAAIKQANENWTECSHYSLSKQNSLLLPNNVISGMRSRTDEVINRKMSATCKQWFFNTKTPQNTQVAKIALF